MWPTLLFGALAAIFVALTLSTLSHQRWARRLPPLDALPDPHAHGDADSALPRCSVVIAARDEAARIERTVTGLLAQVGVALDVIVVDDRSTDGTDEVLRRLSASDARIQSRRVSSLPEGWLGKCHACHVGAAAATGEWILFTDADCWMTPDVVARALRVAARDAADHVTLTPGITGATLSARGWHLAFLASLANWMSGVNRDRAGAHLGIGAFNLVRASAYGRCGGYEALRLTVVDDVKLGLLLHRAGARTRGFIGGDDVACQWGGTVPGMLRIMEKNYFAAIDYQLAPVIGIVVVFLLVTTGVAAGLWSGTPMGVVAGLAPLSLAIPAAVFARRLGWSPVTAMVTPMMYPVLFYAVVRSAYVTLRQGGVRWRDTFYPLETLRQGTVR